MTLRPAITDFESSRAADLCEDRVFPLQGLREYRQSRDDSVIRLRLTYPMPRRCLAMFDRLWAALQHVNFLAKK